MEDVNSARDIASARDTAYVVEDEAQAKLLSEEKSFKYLEPFVAREKSASQAAEEIGCKLEALLYRIGTFLDAGLLHIVRKESRRGRPIKIYRSSADSYFVPFSAMPYADFEEQMHKGTANRNAAIVPALATAIRETEMRGRLIYRHEADDKVWRNSASYPDIEDPMSEIFIRLLEGKEVNTLLDAYHGSLATDFWSTLNLNRAEAKDFMKRLYDLWLEFSLLSPGEDKTRDPYHLAVTFVKELDSAD